MQNDPEFNIKFVQLVKNFPVIYDQTLDKYGHKDATRKAWDDIATELNDTVDACIQKWRVLRGSYTRFLRTRPTGSCNVPGKRAYYLAKHMEFLLPYLRYKPITENGIIDEFMEQESISEVFETVKRERSSSFEDTPNSTSFSDYESNPKEEELVPQSTLKRKTPVQDAKSRLFTPIKKLKIEVEPQQHLQSDPDMDFFKSILPDIKNLPQKMKYKFRMSVLKTISELME